ncbi:MAG TPA: hypothetical protein VGI96_22795 [Streptosporangiaceae bacterium]
MLTPVPLVMAVAAGLIVGGFYYWARRQGLLAAGPAAEGKPGVSLLTEAVAYVGAILLLAGGIAAVSRQWDELGSWGRVGVLAGAGVFFLVAGALVRNVREPAVQRLAGVVWFLSVACAGGATGCAADGGYRSTGAVAVLAVGLVVTAYAAVLWLVRRRVWQNAALFGGLVIAICGLIATIAGGPGPVPVLAYALPLWGFGLAWAWLGRQRYVEPIWVTMPCGVVLALIAPALAAGEHGWMYAIGIATAAAAMAAAVPLRNTPLLALGTLAMFGYVTPAVIRYFHQSLGTPAALAATGALILGLAAVSARLMRNMQA